jgi:L-fuconolactonase
MSTAVSNRRHFLVAGGTALAGWTAGCATVSAAGQAILDTHTHFYDPRRPQGVPWPAPTDRLLYRPVLPPDYNALAEPLGIRGTIVVEASPWPEDNQWILDLAANDPFIVGFIGNLRPGSEEFGRLLKRFAANPLFRGIRIGEPTVGAALRDAAVRKDLEQLGALRLVVDVLVGPDTLPDVATLADRIRSVPFIVDHLSNVPITPPPHPNRWVSGMAACHYVDNVFMKFSGYVEGTGRRGGTAPTDLNPYRPVLDTAWRIFGADRLIFGSNWPVSAEFASLPVVVGLARTFLEERGAAATRKVLHDTAVRVYRPVHRRAVV